MAIWYMNTGKKKRTNVTYDQIPKLVENAFLATEDARFYEHSGVDFKGTARAVLVSLKGDYGSSRWKYNNATGLLKTTSYRWKKHQNVKFRKFI